MGGQPRWSSAEAAASPGWCAQPDGGSGVGMSGLGVWRERGRAGLRDLQDEPDLAVAVQQHDLAAPSDAAQADEVPDVEARDGLLVGGQVERVQDGQRGELAQRGTVGPGAVGGGRVAA